MSTAANPKANQLNPSDAPQEPTGAIASDSLAAESMKAGEGFSENDNAAISSVKGANSTLNNTDTSGASVLPAARDGAAREQNQAKGLGSDERGTTGATLDTLGDAEFSGTHSSEGYVGGPSATGTGTSTSTSTGGGNLPSGATGDSFADGSAPSASSYSTGSSAIKSSSASGSAQTSSGSGGSSSAGTAPNYAATVSGALRPEGEDKPKGENLVEGGIPETKTFTGNVGGVNDPGRLAEKDFTKIAPGSAVIAGATGGNQGDGGAEFTGGQYDVLSSERA